ncbi:MAG: endonuclease domain-containing protein [Chitinophagaceae bacterium]|nr:MAG: endonuclease domain-containing protein [Chitinophagaceae bacterium]
MSSKYDDKLFKGASPQIFENAKELRRASTAAEDLLWQELRNRKLAGLKFCRQHPLNNYIADFYCSEKQLVIEVDGNIHNNPEIKEYDERRTKDLADMGIQVLRFTNDEVETNMPNVLQRIKDFITKQDS